MDFSTPDVPFYKSHISEIIAVIVIIIGALTLMALLNINLNEETNKTIQKVVTIESFDNELTGEYLCSSKTNPSELNSLCNQLTQKNCRVAGCCVLLNGNKCVGGSKDGPTFETENGKKLNIDYYYYKDKCFGKCPSDTIMQFDAGENEVVEAMSVQSRPVQVTSGQDTERQTMERQARLIQNRPVDIISGWDTERQARERQARERQARERQAREIQARPAPVISEQARERQPREERQAITEQDMQRQARERNARLSQAITARRAETG